jgi:hypothetical protein
MTVNLSLIKYFNKLSFAPISYVPVFRGGGLQIMIKWWVGGSPQALLRCNHAGGL